MLQIGICDDQKEVRFKLHSLLENILENKHIQNQIYEFSSGEGLCTWYQNHIGELDLVFLDIEMSGINGIKTSKNLASLDPKLLLCFVTGHPDYVFEGYNVNALGYVLKPPNITKLEDIIIRALGRLIQEKDDLFICKNGESNYRIVKNSICYFQSQGRKVSCITTNKTYEFYAKLDDIADEIGSKFIRIHQRYLVNADFVEAFDKTELSLGNITLPISRAYSQSVMLDLTKASL